MNEMDAGRDRATPEEEREREREKFYGQSRSD